MRKLFTNVPFAWSTKTIIDHLRKIYSSRKTDFPLSPTFSWWDFLKWDAVSIAELFEHSVKCPHAKSSPLLIGIFTEFLAMQRINSLKFEGLPRALLFLWCICRKLRTASAGIAYENLLDNSFLWQARILETLWNFGKFLSLMRYQHHSPLSLFTWRPCHLRILPNPRSKLFRLSHFRLDLLI